MPSQIVWADAKKKRCPRCNQLRHVLLYRDDGSIVCGPCLHAIHRNSSVDDVVEEFQKAKRLEIHEPKKISWKPFVVLVLGLSGAIYALIKIVKGEP